jgi:2-polyprenyl-3-methyl-5-hydroxy-6-metoxy-1,4-benzoquinol methylase
MRPKPLISSIVKGELTLSFQSQKWDRLVPVHDREREVACNAYLDLISGRRTKNVELALELALGSPMLIEVPHVLKALTDVRGKKILDAGCGGGFYSLWLAERGAEVLGIDASKRMIRIAKEKASRKMLDAEFSIGDITDLGVEDGVFDVVLSTLVLMEVGRLNKAVSELVRVARKEGDIVISIQHPTLTAGDWERESGQKLFRKLDDYFAERDLETAWEDEGGERLSFKYYHRPLQDYVQPFLERGCALTYLVEPSPHETYKILNPKEYEDTRRIPHFIVFKFRKQQTLLK